MAIARTALVRISATVMGTAVQDMAAVITIHAVTVMDATTVMDTARTIPTAGPAITATKQHKQQQL
jgi:hypothetical protein